MFGASNLRKNAFFNSNFNKSAAITQTYKLSYHADQNLATKRMKLETYSVLLDKNIIKDNGALVNQLKNAFFFNSNKKFDLKEIFTFIKKIDEFLQSTKTNLDFELKNSDHFFKCSLILVDNYLFFNLLDLSFLNKFYQIDYDKIFSQITTTIWLTDEKGVIKGINQQWDRNAEHFEELEKQRGTFRKALYSNELIGKNFSDFLVGKKSKLFYSFIKLLLKFFPKLSYEFWANDPCESECKEKELLHMVYTKQRLNISGKRFHVHLAINYTPFTDELCNYYLQLQIKQFFSLNKFLKIPFKELINKSFESNHIFFLSRFRHESFLIRYLQLREIFLRNYRIKESIAFNDNSLPALTLNLLKLNHSNILITSNNLFLLQEYFNTSNMNFATRNFENKDNQNHFSNLVNIFDIYIKNKLSITNVSLSEIEITFIVLTRINSKLSELLEINFTKFPLLMPMQVSPSSITNNQLLMPLITYSDEVNKITGQLFQMNKLLIMLKNISYPYLKNAISYNLANGGSIMSFNMFANGINEEIVYHIINKFFMLNVILSVREFSTSKMLIVSQKYSRSNLEMEIANNIAKYDLRNSFYELIEEIKSSNYFAMQYLFDKAVFNDFLNSPNFIKSNYNYLNYYYDQKIGLNLFDHQKDCYTSNHNYDLYNLVAMSNPKDEKIGTLFIQTSLNNHNHRIMTISAYKKIYADRIILKGDSNTDKTINKIAINQVMDTKESTISSAHYKIFDLNTKKNGFLDNGYIFKLLVLLRTIKKKESNYFKNRNFLKFLFSIIFMFTDFFTFIKAKCQ
ncbi:MAG: hypothetical protein QXF76_02950 [Candidatus Anstonellales archaeon]